jgi:hypothetical protein
MKLGRARSVSSREQIKMAPPPGRPNPHTAADGGTAARCGSSALSEVGSDAAPAAERGALEGKRNEVTKKEGREKFWQPR